MANSPQDPRSGAPRPEGERDFNTIHNSASDKRRKNKTLQRYTLLAVLLLMAMLLVVLVVMAIGGIASHVSDNDKNPPSDTDKNAIVWGNITVSASDSQQGPLVLVNNAHAYTFPSTDEHLGEIWATWNAHKPAQYQQSGISEYMEKTALAALDTMLTDFATATGRTNSVQIRSAYRTLADQEGKEIAPGHSDHHTGYGCELKYVKDGGTVAIDFSNDAIYYDWFTANAHKYGFIVRYPADKTAETGVSDYTSYYRYVGVPHATYMKANGLCMEEYIALLHDHTHESPLTVTAPDGKQYDIYYAAVEGSATVPYPTNLPYSYSGTNEGGVVVTVDRSGTVTPTESGNAPADTAASTTAYPAG